MAANSTDISVCARISDLPRLMRELAEGARQIGIADEVGQRLQLIVEELFTNTVRHGFQGDGDTLVTCRLSAGPEGILLRYADAAPAYDPTGTTTQAASDNAVGGLGIALIRGFSRHFDYERQNGLNICTVRI